MKYKNKKGSSPVPLFFAIISILAIGFFLPLIVTAFTGGEITSSSNVGIFETLANYTNGSLIQFNYFSPLPTINPFAILPQSAQNLVTNDLLIWGILPTEISVPLGIILFLSLIYGLIKLIPTEG